MSIPEISFKSIKENMTDSLKIDISNRYLS